MSVNSRQVAVSTSAVVLDPTADPMIRYQLAVVVASGTVWVGASGVTSANGLQLTAGQGLTLDLGRGEVLYGISDSGGAVVHVLQAAGGYAA